MERIKKGNFLLVYVRHVGMFVYIMSERLAHVFFPFVAPQHERGELRIIRSDQKVHKHENEFRSFLLGHFHSSGFA